MSQSHGGRCDSACDKKKSVTRLVTRRLSAKTADRLRLPNRRQCEAVSFEHAGVAYVGKVSRFEDTAAIAEVFLNPSVKTGTALAHMVAALAVTASIALQHGASAEEIAHALPKLHDGSAADPLGKLLDMQNLKGETRP